MTDPTDQQPPAKPKGAVRFYIDKSLLADREKLVEFFKQVIERNKACDDRD